MTTTTTIAPETTTEPAATGNDLTTNAAPFIEGARDRGDLFIRQPYELYSERNHEAWRRLYSRLVPRWRQYAHQKFIEGIDCLAMDPEAVPRLEDVNRFLAPLTGFKAKAVSGYIPSYLFFDCLRRREFPTTVTVRNLDSLDYLQEPDLFHDVAGHVPMHTDKDFAEVLVRFGEVAHQTALRTAEILTKDDDSLSRLDSAIKALARFFWFTVEFGLMRSGGKKNELKVYGSGLLSSYGEIAHAIDSPEVQRYDFNLGWVINQYFEIDSYQPLLFVVDSFDHLYSQIEELERWLLDGKLYNVSLGEPLVSQADLESYVKAAD